MLFVRLYGCNLDCGFCDQPSALSTRPQNHVYEMAVDEVADLIAGYPRGVPVCLTGGEPTFQHERVVDLVNRVREMEDESLEPARLFTMETNGMIYVPALAGDVNFYVSCSPKFQNVAVNGVAQVFGGPDIRRWIDSEVPMHLKFVVEHRKSFEGILAWIMEKVPRGALGRIPIYFQPEWYKGRDEYKKLVKEYCTPEKWGEFSRAGIDARFSTQVHKLIGLH